MPHFKFNKKKIKFKVSEEDEKKSLESFAKLVKSTSDPNYRSEPRLSDDEVKPFN